MAKDVSAPKVAEEAPDFALKPHLDTDVKLSEILGTDTEFDLFCDVESGVCPPIGRLSLRKEHRSDVVQIPLPHLIHWRSQKAGIPNALVIDCLTLSLRVSRHQA